MQNRKEHTLFERANHDIRPIDGKIIPSSNLPSVGKVNVPSKSTIDDLYSRLPSNRESYDETYEYTDKEIGKFEVTGETKVGFSWTKLFDFVIKILAKLSGSRERTLVIKGKLQRKGSKSPQNSSF